MKKIFLFTALFVVIFSQSVLGEETEFRLFVDATLGVDVENPSQIDLNLGETGGIFIKIVNEANIRDKIRIQGQLTPPTDWIEFAFICGETPGICDSVPSSEIHFVDEIELTPEINTTEVFLEITGWRKTATFDPMDVPKMTITGFSLTNRTKQGLADIPIIIEDKNAGFGPLASPGLANPSVLILFILTLIIVAMRKDVF